MRLIDRIPVKAIERLVDYLYDDECKGYANCCDADGPEYKANHIFHSVKEVADWLDTVPGALGREDRAAAAWASFNEQALNGRD